MVFLVSQPLVTMFFNGSQPLVQRCDGNDTSLRSTMGKTLPKIWKGKTLPKGVRLLCHPPPGSSPCPITYKHICLDTGHWTLDSLAMNLKAWNFPGALWPRVHGADPGRTAMIFTLFHSNSQTCRLQVKIWRYGHWVSVYIDDRYLFFQVGWDVLVKPSSKVASEKGWLLLRSLLRSKGVLGDFSNKWQSQYWIVTTRSWSCCHNINRYIKSGGVDRKGLRQNTWELRGECGLGWVGGDYGSLLHNIKRSWEMKTKCRRSRGECPLRRWWI